MEENYDKNSSTRVDSTFDYLSPSPSLFRTYIEITMYSVPNRLVSSKFHAFHGRRPQPNRTMRSSTFASKSLNLLHACLCSVYLCQRILFRCTYM